MSRSSTSSQRRLEPARLILPGVVSHRSTFTRVTAPTLRPALGKIERRSRILGGTANLPPNAAAWRPPPPSPTRYTNGAARAGGSAASTGRRGAAAGGAEVARERTGPGAASTSTSTSTRMNAKTSDKGAAAAATSLPAKIQVNTLNSKFPIIEEAAVALGYDVVKEENMNADVFWFDGPSPPELFRRMESHQKVNNFPATGEISRKDCLSKNIARLAQSEPEEFDFVPRGWIIPAELSTLQKHDAALTKRGKAHCYIVKPVNSAMGRGIFLITSTDQLYSSGNFTKAESAIVQEYLHDPLLIDGFKFDLRIYVLVTSCDPLRAFMYKDGLVRLGSSKYEAPTAANANDLFMHLTNYSINKESGEFDNQSGEDKGSKRSIKWLNSWLRREGVDVRTLWSRISDLLVKTLIVGVPHNKHTYNLARGRAGGSGSGSNAGHPADESTCFQLYGFDVLIEKDLKPYLIEVNRSPSFGATSPLDRSIKLELVKSTLRLLSLDVAKSARYRENARREAKKRITGAGDHRPSSSRHAAGNGSGNDGDVEAGHIKSTVVGVCEALEHEQVIFEDRVCGEYERIFPPQQSSDRLAVYETLIAVATREFFGKGKASATAAPLPPPTVKVAMDLAALGIAGIVATAHRASAAPATGSGAGGSVPPEERDCSSTSDGAEVDGKSKAKAKANPYGKGNGPADVIVAEGWALWQDGGNFNSNSGGSGGVSGSGSGSGGGRRNSAGARAKLQRLGSKKPSTKKKMTSLSATSAAAKLEALEIECIGTSPRATKGSSKVNARSGVNADVLSTGGVDMDEFEALKLAPPYSQLRHFYFKMLDWGGRALLFKFVMHALRTHLFAGTSGKKSGRMFELLTKVFERLLRSKGQGLWNTFEICGLEWASLSNILFLGTCTPQEQVCCCRVVELCRDALMLAFLATKEKVADGGGADGGGADGGGADGGGSA